MKYSKLGILVFAILFLCSCEEEAKIKEPINAFVVEGRYYETKGFMPKDSLVPDKITALKIADAIWQPIYRKELYQYWPFSATLNEKNQWVVKGTRSKNQAFIGIPIMIIEKSDGKIVKIDHIEE